MQKIGAEGGTRTPTGCPIRPSNVRVYQFHHFGKSEKIKSSLLFLSWRSTRGWAGGGTRTRTRRDRNRGQKHASRPGYAGILPAKSACHVAFLPVCGNIYLTNFANFSLRQAVSSLARAGRSQAGCLRTQARPSLFSLKRYFGVWS